MNENLRGAVAQASAALVPVEDALVPDSTSLSEDEVLQRIERLIQQKLDR